jgi:hypothetical protein
MSNYFCFHNNKSIFIYNINQNKLLNYNDNVDSLCYNDNYLIYSKNNFLYVMDIKKLIIIKMININYIETDYDFVYIRDIIIINTSIICRVNYLTYYLDRQGLFYKKSTMMTFDIDTLELLYETDSFNAYNLIASNTKIIGKHLNKIIIFNEKLEILSEINSSQNYNINKVFGNDTILLTDEKNIISPDNKYIFLLNNNTISIFDIDRTTLYETINCSDNIIITNDYRIIYWTDKINIIKTSLYYNLINIISNELLNYLPIELVDNVFNYL